MSRKVHKKLLAGASTVSTRYVDHYRSPCLQDRTIPEALVVQRLRLLDKMFNELNGRLNVLLGLKGVSVLEHLAVMIGSEQREAFLMMLSVSASLRRGGREWNYCLSRYDKIVFMLDNILSNLHDVILPCTLKKMAPSVLFWLPMVVGWHRLHVDGVTLAAGPIALAQLEKRILDIRAGLSLTSTDELLAVDLTVLREEHMTKEEQLCGFVMTINERWVDLYAAVREANISFAVRSHILREIVAKNERDTFLEGLSDLAPRHAKELVRLFDALQTALSSARNYVYLYAPFTIEENAANIIEWLPMIVDKEQVDISPSVEKLSTDNRSMEQRVLQEYLAFNYGVHADPPEYITDAVITIRP